jgi:hypothetical protein
VNKCGFETCDREIANSGLCAGHNNQRYRGKPLKPLRSYKKSVVADGLRKCRTCDLVKSSDHFYLRNDGTWQTECVECYAKRNKARYEAHNGH